MAPTNWICIKCGVTNPKNFLKCQTCQEPKPIFWECTCKRKNPTAALKCSDCKRHRPAIYGATVAMKGLSKMKFASEGSNRTAEGSEDALLGAKSDSLSGPMPVAPVASSFQASPASTIDSVVAVGSTLSGKYPSALTKSTLDYNVSYYDIFKKLSQPSRTTRPVNYVDDETKLTQIVAHCTQSNNTFIDPHFPPTSRTLYYDPEHYKQIIEKDKTAKVYWLRHRHTKPIDKDSRALAWCVTRDPVVNDITQGVLGNCWLLTALAVLVERPNLLDKILAVKELSERGVYRVRLFRDGKLNSVIIDDYFPCNGRRYHIYSSAKRKQLFVSIIEKAMAKLYGCYESLVSGQVIEGLAALTGFPCRSIRIHSMPKDQKKSPTNNNRKGDENGSGGTGSGDDDPSFDPDFLWTMLLSYYTAGFLMGAACGSVTKIPVSASVLKMQQERGHQQHAATPGDDEDYTKMGLLNHHAYSIVSVVHVEGADLRLIRLRNPWGTQVWNGDWSDGSSLWTPELKEQLKPVAASEGIFWMSFVDFQRYFEKVDVCKLRDSWNEMRFEGYFPRDCKDNRFTSVFQLVVEEAGTEVELTLYQDSRRSAMLKDWPLVPIGMSVFQMQDLQWKLAGDFLDTSGYKMREFVGCDLMLDKGMYLVAVYCFNHWQNAAKMVENANPADTKQQALIRSGLHIRPKYMMSAHSSRTVQLSAFCIAPAIIGDTLIEMVLAKGRKKDHNENVTSYYLHENWAGLLVVIENRNKDCFLDVLFDASESLNLATTRGALLTQDTIPPTSRQLINILSHLDSNTSYYLSYQLSYRVSNQSTSVHNPEISHVKSLHSPRPFKQISEQQASKPQKAAVGGIEQQLKAMIEQQKKMGQFGQIPKIAAPVVRPRAKTPVPPPQQQQQTPTKSNQSQFSQPLPTTSPANYSGAPSSTSPVPMPTSLSPNINLQRYKQPQQMQHQQQYQPQSQGQMQMQYKQQQAQTSAAQYQQQQPKHATGQYSQQQQQQAQTSAAQYQQQPPKLAAGQYSQQQQQQAQTLAAQYQQQQPKHATGQYSQQQQAQTSAAQYQQQQQQHQPTMTQQQLQHQQAMARMTPQQLQAYNQRLQQYKQQQQQQQNPPKG